MPGVGFIRPAGGGGAGGGASVAVVLDDDTPKLGQSVTITATATGITPTSYTFYLPQQNGTLERVTQVGNTYDWTVSKYEDFTVTVRATDGSSEGVGTADGTTTGDVDADAIITAQEAAISGSMDATAKDWVLGFVLRLKGIYTTFNENVFEQLATANAELYAMFPDTSATASVAGYSINAIDPTRNATMVGFVSGDATVNGLTGGSGKYMIMNNAPSDYSQNDIGIDTYLRTRSTTTCQIGTSVGPFTSSDTGAFIMSFASSSGRIRCKMNSAYYLTQSSLVVDTGFISLQRDKSDRFDVCNDGDVSELAYFSSLSPDTNVFYGMAVNIGGTAIYNTTESVSMLCNRPYLPENTLKALVEAVIWLQTQIGRNV
jgi:hypothetical protein